MKVILADDHMIVREGLRLAIESSGNHSVIGEADNGRRAVELADELQADLVVMDIAMPEMNGIEAARKLMSMPHNRAKVLFLSMHSDSEFVLEAFRTGAAGYVTKASAMRELVSAIDAIASGRTYISPSIADVVLTPIVRRSTAEPTTETGKPQLTPREREILKLLAEGLSAKECAVRLGISNKTVHAFRGQLMDKLNLRSIPELTKYAIKNGFATLD